MGKAKLEFVARITTEDGEVIERRVSAEDVLSPSEVDHTSLDGFLTSFETFEQSAISARNQIGKDITQAWIEEQAKKRDRRKEPK